MRTRNLFRGVQPYITAIAVVLIAAFLVGAIYFTELGMHVGAQWITFLSGILIASILGMASRASRAEWIITRRTAQLAALKEKLEQEAQLRKKTEADHQQSLLTLQKTEMAFGRLIPHQLLKLLDRSSILDVKLGDQVERKLTIMFSDIRNFTSLSETMTPQENFNFLNSYLKQMDPILSSHRGIIDKYVGDTILALFTHSADDALSGALHMLEKLDEYNTGRARAGYPPIQIGLGLNTGLVMIGTVGGAIRMESTVIGDAVNLTSRIEEATKVYQTPLLISQNTLYDLAIPGKYDIRFLDRIRVKGKTQPLSIYEVFDNDPVKVRDGKRATKIKFEEAVAYYHLKHIPRAMELFKQCIETVPKDIPARLYLSRCERYLAAGQHFSTGELNTPMEWKGEFQIGIKEIDQSHSHVFSKANEFIAASLAKDASTIREIFDHLVSHHAESEREEEELMRRYNYPFLASHLQEHKRFIENFAALKEEADAGDFDLPYLTFRTQLLLLDWFNGHIAKSDRHAGRYLIGAMQLPPSGIP
jgi:adenylate cyclase